MNHTYIAGAVVLIFIHALYATFSTRQAVNEVPFRSELTLLLLLIWVIPFAGAYIANRRMNPKWRQSFQPIDREASLMSSSNSSHGAGGD
ncbi:hypothetical protein [Zhongshania marina]|uniref:Uncharacterized protein n=1 Tax=Zhongshania marina TaxID=2304603 RepID=A0A2S4HAK2_9GAMM|nr:hypothetical protein [Marortus luteolus]POP50993.1 hypothetical protein C0068_19360 [Marortus luteolus]